MNSFHRELKSVSGVLDCQWPLLFY